MSGRCGGATAPVAPPYVATSVAAAPQRAHRPMGQRLAPVSTPAGTSAAQRPRIGGGVRPSPLDRLTPAYGRRQPPPYVGGHACIVSPCWPPGGRLPPGGASASRQHEQIPRNGGFCIKKRSGPDSIACVTRCGGNGVAGQQAHAARPHACTRVSPLAEVASFGCMHA
jgi:hypothetical protein